MANARGPVHRPVLPVVVLLLVIATIAAASTARQEPARGQSPPSPSSAPPAPRTGPALDENDDNDNAARRARVNATAKLELPAGTVRVMYPLLPANGPDAAALATLADGAVLELTRSMAMKLKTEVELRFEGGAVARTGNASPAYAGVYSLWLRRAGDGWRLVLNREPDIWGTMRDPAADVGETALAHVRVPDAEAKATLEAKLDATNGGGELTIAWGSDRFTAHFDAGPGLAVAGAGKGASP